jgi:general secretion pathway protein M
MIDLVSKRIPRGVLFLAFNASAVLFLVLFVFAPVLTHFSSRSEEISENAAQLSHFQILTRDAEALIKKAPHAGDPFLPGSEERVVSADLQASLKAIATTANVRFLGIHGLQGTRSQQLRMVAASVELEGSLPSIRNVIMAIENQMPLLFVTAASLRSLADGDEGLIRAELEVQGAMRDSGSPTSPAEAISQ